MISPSTKLSRFVVASLLLALAAAPPVSAGAVDEIRVMLEGGLSEQTILDWLEAGEEEIDRPSAKELIELKQAGASEELLRELLRRSRSSVAMPPPAMEAPATEASVATPVPALPSRPKAAAAAPANRPTAEPVTGGGHIPVEFRLFYSPRFDEDQEPWDLFVYLDGHPLSYVPSTSELLGLTAGEPLEVAVALPPGKHSVRVLQERHEQRRRGWRHSARVAAEAFSFELLGGEAAKVAIDFRQGWGNLTDPLTFRFTQGGRVADVVDVGDDPELWPELCEDAGLEPSRGDCVGWASLWPGPAEPSRAEVLDLLARFEFRPVPR